ncbi:hypothetical protein HDE78_002659 [Rhodanobacter sp. K2T2]|uniref:hypothetical protein n=1 Tax=Rhodanobacter sp. K2T2 TaxID=2723085 RepID=UPI0015CA448B|nr:hypothetical protein [Rhodanobacter sp. K2T2]NYE29693.1 hypothetical protein [Rhodanobacter sp. K2T2]
MRDEREQRAMTGTLPRAARDEWHEEARNENARNLRRTPERAKHRNARWPETHQTGETESQLRGSTQKENCSAA